MDFENAATNILRYDLAVEEKRLWRHTTDAREGVDINLWMICGDCGAHSYVLWNAAADAVAKVLREAGIIAYSESRVD